MTAPMRTLWTGFEPSRGQFGRIVDGEGVHLILEDGRRVLDGTNTGAPLGHRHPDIVEAMSRAARAPVIHEAWDSVARDKATEDLAQIAFVQDPGWLGGVHWCLSGSEANDLALSLAQAFTGRSALATRVRAYHGGSGLARETTVQPQWHGGLVTTDGRNMPVPHSVAVYELAGPLGERIGPNAPDAELDRAQLADAEAQLADVAAVIIDYTQGAVYHSGAYQDHLAHAARRAGALWIADEVVTGLGRTGCWFSFQGGETRPDIVTLGKGLGGGAAPCGAVLVSRSLAEQLDGALWQTAGTLRGHVGAASAISAHLALLAREQLVARAGELDGVMLALLQELASAHPSVRRIDGRGLHWTIELHGTDWQHWHGDASRQPIATRVAAKALEAGALIMTSGEEGFLVLAPALISTEKDLERLVDALDHGLTLADVDV